MRSFNMMVENEPERSRRVTDVPAGLEYSFLVSIPEEGWDGRLLVRIEEPSGQLHFKGDVPDDPELRRLVKAEVGRRAQILAMGAR